MRPRSFSPSLRLTGARCQTPKKFLASSARGSSLPENFKALHIVALPARRIIVRPTIAAIPAPGPASVDLVNALTCVKNHELEEFSL